MGDDKEPPKIVPTDESSKVLPIQQPNPAIDVEMLRLQRVLDAFEDMQGTDERYRVMFYVAARYKLDKVE